MERRIGKYLNMDLKSGKFLLSTLVVLIVGVSVGYYLFIFETPEDCFVRKMKEWGISEEITDKVEVFTQGDSKMAVAMAKTFTNEFDYKDIGDENQRIYLQAKTFFNYCKIK